MHDGIYSQSNEEIYIKKHLGKTIGSFLDIGAFDGKAFSNTYRLVLDGWSGVCIEPSPSVLPALKNLHKDNPKIVVAEYAVVVDKNKKLVFYDSGGDAISSFNKAHVDKWASNWGTKFKEVDVEKITVEEMFDKFGYDFDFINLDVEAMNWELFQRLPLAKLTKTKMFCVEHDGKMNEILSMTKKYGFREVHRNGENLIVAR
jgi:FkbM family methyltransferase